MLTQKYLATVLHVRRESVTEAAAALRSRDLISYSRGTIRILNRKGLLSASCSCYRQVEFLQAQSAAADSVGLLRLQRRHSPPTAR